MGTPLVFGDYVRDRRLALGMSLRAFASFVNQDAANISRVERGQLTPPQDQNTLALMARTLEIKPNTTEWLELHDLAAVGSRRIPPDIAADPTLVARLPALFRSLRFEHSDPRQLDALKSLVGGGGA